MIDEIEYYLLKNSGEVEKKFLNGEETIINGIFM